MPVSLNFISPSARKIDLNRPSKFDSAELVAGCGSISDILRFAFPGVLRSIDHVFSVIRFSLVLRFAVQPRNRLPKRTDCDRVTLNGEPLNL